MWTPYTIRFAWVVSRGGVKIDAIGFYSYSYKETDWIDRNKYSCDGRIGNISVKSKQRIVFLGRLTGE